MSSTRNPREAFGNTEPRVFTPPLRELNEQTSLGYLLDEFAREMLGIELLPYQRWLGIHALELTEGLTVDGIPDWPEHEPIFRFRRIVVLIARQNGKTLFSQVLAAFFMFIMRVRLIIGTAHTLSLAEEVLFGVSNMVDESEELSELMDKPMRGSGKVALRKKDGAQYVVKAMTGGAGRGLRADLLLLDELRQQRDWKAWAAVKNTTQARPRALIWCMSNAGDVESVVLRTLRIKAHAAVGDPDGIAKASDPSKLLDAEMLATDESEHIDDTGLFEWSAPPGIDKHDVTGWQAANPALGYAGLTLRTLASGASGDPEWVFRTEALCQWPDGSLEGPFPPGAWDAGIWRTEDHDGEEMPESIGAEKVCLSMPVDRSLVHAVVAGRDESGQVIVQHVARRQGTEWVAEWLQSRIDAGHIDEITGQTRGSPVAELLERLKAQGFPVTDWKGPELSAGVGRFYDAVCNQDFIHFEQDHMDIAAATAVKKITESGSMFFDLRKSPVDAAPLEAAAGAYWLLTRPKEEPKQSAYEGRGLLVL